ncbi:MAG: hypothetical protein WBA10_14690 [Elainellaceae cyanobacterium]
MASTHQRALGVFADRTVTASALQALRDSGFSMGDTSVITREAGREADIAGVKVKDSVGNRAETGGGIGAATGGVLGGIAGLLVGLGTLAIPGVGPLVLAGEAATVLTTVIGAAGGAVAGSLVGALIGLGVPEHRAKEYSDRVFAGDYLLMLKGNEIDLHRAEQVLNQHNIQDWGVFDAAGRVDTHNSQHESVETGHGAIRAFASTSNADASTDQRRVIGLFSDWQTLETALAKVREMGLPLGQVAIAVRDDKRNTDYLTGGLARPLGGVTGMLSGLNRIEVPDVGSILVVGPETATLTKASRDGHINSLSSALTHLGIAEEQAGLYGRRIADGDVLVTLRGDDNTAQEAAAMLGHHGMRDWGVYDIRDR